MRSTYIFMYGLCGLLAGTVTALFLQTSLSSEWGQWIVLQAQPQCFLFRRRNCTSDGCISAEYKYCDGVAYWSDWGPWQCSVQMNTCFIARTRTCSVAALVNCNSNETNHILSALDNSETCPCKEDSSNSITTTARQIMWNPWGPWVCHSEQDPCLRYRHRNCSTHFEEDCSKQGGIAYELVACGEICAGML